MNVKGAEEKLKDIFGIKEVDEIHKRFENGEETLEDLLKHYISYYVKFEIKNKEIETEMIELKYYKKLVSLIQQQEKMIDKMAQKIAKIDNSDQYCLGRKRMCPYDKPTQSKCKECIKYYYEKRNKNGNCKSR